MEKEDKADGVEYYVRADGMCQEYLMVLDIMCKWMVWSKRSKVYYAG